MFPAIRPSACLGKTVSVITITKDRGRYKVSNKRGILFHLDTLYSVHSEAMTLHSEAQCRQSHYTVKYKTDINSFTFVL